MPSTQPDDGRTSTNSAPFVRANEPDHPPFAVAHAEMNAAYDTGEAVPLGQSISWLVRYRDAWWVVYERGWLRVADDITSAELDQVAARLGQAEAATTRAVPPRNPPLRDGTAVDRGTVWRWPRWMRRALDVSASRLIGGRQPLTVEVQLDFQSVGDDLRLP
jgi:hypothetical protein